MIHAHSTSVFAAATSFPVGRRPALVWHDHFPGAPERSPRALRAVRDRIDVAVAVSRRIEEADRRALGLGGRLTWLPNFSRLEGGDPPAADLPGVAGRRVVCVANLRPAKDQLTVVRALTRVRDTHPDVHLLLVGSADGDYGDEVRAEVRALDLEGHVSLLGVRTDVAAVLAAADVAVLASLEEGTPLAVIEYGLAGRAVVATDVGEVGDVLDGGRAGRLVEPGDAEALAGAVAGLLDDEAERLALGARLSARVAERYSVGALMEQWEAVYRRALIRNG